ncbi:MAG: hypothetical protein D6828_02980 [Nitrospirae bacterium]|nr:MAG: hypothetical protein D6828_02980 [Nitrospirota bacterium]
MEGRYKISHIKIISIVCSLLFLSTLFITKDASSQGLVILAKKVSGELTLDPEDAKWKEAEEVEIPVAPQVMAIPRIYDSPIKNIHVRAIHNSKEIAFLVEWEDKTEDIILDVDTFPDAVALEFPSQSANSMPHFGMGDDESTANIWYWKSIWQTPKGQPQPSEVATKAKEYKPHFRTDEKTHIFVDDFLTGVLAGNPVSTPGRSPVENLVARGFSTLTDNETEVSAKLSGYGTWQSNKWQVVFKRALSSKDPFDAAFVEGKVTPVAFAVWDGYSRQRGGRKSVSTWYYVGLETEEKATVYIYPILAFILSVVVLYGLIMWIRVKRTS